MTDPKDKNTSGKGAGDVPAADDADKTMVLGGSFASLVEAEQKKSKDPAGEGDKAALPEGTPDDPFGESVKPEDAAPTPTPGGELGPGDDIGAVAALPVDPFDEFPAETGAGMAAEAVIGTDIEAASGSQAAGDQPVPLAPVSGAALEGAEASEDSGPEALFAALEHRPYDFGFFPLIRRLENHYRDKPRIGESVRPADDPVRLGQEPSVIFAASTLTHFERGEDDRPARLTGLFLGLFGPNGPLPLHLSEFARDRSRNFRDNTFTAFADVFHHRMLSLFYRAWASGEPAVSFDRPDDDRFSSFVASTCGRGLEAFRHRDYMPDVGKLYFAGRLALQTRNAEGLMAIISDFFKVPVTIRQFVGEWLELPEHQLCRLGESRLTGALGVNTTVGRRVWSCQYKFRLIFGPMSLKDYERLLPGGKSLERLVAVVRNYIGDELSWDVNLILKKKEVPELRLGQTGRLGWTSWLMPRPEEKDANDLYLFPLRLLRTLN